LFFFFLLLTFCKQKQDNKQATKQLVEVEVVWCFVRIIKLNHNQHL